MFPPEERKRIIDEQMNHRVTSMPEEEALAIMDEQEGRYFDPRVYDSFKRTLPKLRRIREEVREEEEASPYLSGSFHAPAVRSLNVHPAAKGLPVPEHGEAAPHIPSEYFPLRDCSSPCHKTIL